MTARKANPMPAALSRKLGGMARAANAGREGMAAMGRKGAAANIAKNGADQPLRALAIARGHHIASIAPSRTARGEGANQQPEANATTPSSLAGRDTD